MRIHFVSDLHLEFAPFDPPSTNADVTVLAGDTHAGVRGVQWAAEAFLDRPVIYVPGNHEFYGQNAPELVTKLRERGRQLGVHVLSDEEITIGGVRFLGTTLWTDFKLHDSPRIAMMAAQEHMNDYRKIRLSPTYRKLRPADTAKWHAQARHWLAGKLAEPCALPTVVITHHAPSARSISPRFSMDDLSPVYASDLDDLVEASGAALWIHGHTHHNVSYRIGTTEVIANQRGYPNDPAASFVPDLVMTVE